MTELNKWITPEELQRLLGLSLKKQSALRAKYHQEKDEYPLPFTKIGKRVFYNIDQINEWLIKNGNQDTQRSLNEEV